MHNQIDVILALIENERRAKANYLVILLDCLIDERGIKVNRMDSIVGISCKNRRGNGYKMQVFVRGDHLSRNLAETFRRGFAIPNNRKVSELKDTVIQHCITQLVTLFSPKGIPPPPPPPSFQPNLAGTRINHPRGLG